MRQFFSILIGLGASVFLVFIPFKADLIAANAMQSGFTPQDILQGMAIAAHISPCNRVIVSKLGDIAFEQSKMQIALNAYATAMHCSPADAMLRAKYGEALFSLGFDGTFAIKESVQMEPNNPIYAGELRRVQSYGFH